MTETLNPSASIEPVQTLDHAEVQRILGETDNLLIIQDLDGVCMGLVRDPLTREISADYVRATQRFAPHFYVLTNGEHVGQRGVNRIVERAVGGADVARSQGLYLPGLAAGGVQWQDRQGQLEYPGVSQAELDFLAGVPDRIRACLQEFLAGIDHEFSSAQIEQGIAAATLDNVASPTANLNQLYDLLHGHGTLYADLQRTTQQLMDTLLAEAAEQGLRDSFFVHYAPNLGRDEAGQERIWISDGSDSGTTDFQFMLRGAIKEAGVLAILNRYYYHRTGHYPLGEDFSARSAPHDLADLLALVQTHFDPAQMPLLIGVGDTVTSQVIDGVAQRGGSDRNFLTLIQAIGQSLDTPNLVMYVDSSGGEVKNRRALNMDPADPYRMLAGPCDPRDREDPLRFSVVFPGGHPQYTALFQAAAAARPSR